MMDLWHTLHLRIHRLKNVEANAANISHATTAADLLIHGTTGQPYI